MPLIRKPVVVYNASNRNVYAKVENRSVIEKEKGVGFSVGAASILEGGVTLSDRKTFDTSAKDGYTMIQRFSWANFYPDPTTETAYVSVIPYNADDSAEYRHLCADHPVKSSGGGVIITKEFYFRNSKDGWIDNDDKNHTPKSMTRTGDEPSGLKYLMKKKTKD